MAWGADKDSNTSPRCHPGTRKRLIMETEEWLMKLDRQSNLLWLYGTAGVGKSAVAQTIAEHADNCNRLGAAFFFSESDDRSDYNKFWITIAYQLAVHIPEYRELVERQIDADPNVLRQAPHTQFKKLIVKPLSSLPTSPKFLIIIDGLDECKMETTQSNIIDLISNLIHSTPSFPALWMICSRPEHHIKHHFSKLPIGYYKVELPIDADWARYDVATFLRSRFQEICDKHSDILGESWPPEADLQEIIDDASGLFALASTVVRYVDDPEHNHPEARLQTVILHLRTSGPADGDNPMAKLDLLYTHILSEIPRDILPATLRIIHSTLHSFKSLFSPLAAIYVANFLGMSRGDFYRALRKLHSLLRIPSPQDATKAPIEFSHKSFRDYLFDPRRSGRFHQSREDVACDMLHSFCQLTSTSPYQQGNMNALPNFPLTWTLSDLNEYDLNRWLFNYCAVDMPRHISTCDGTHEGVFTAVRNLDYNLVAVMQSGSVNPFVAMVNQSFCAWLTATPQAHRFKGIVRTKPICDTDREILDVFLTQFPGALPIPDLSFRLLRPSPATVIFSFYFLLGYGSKSVVGVQRISSIGFYSVKYPFTANNVS